MNRIDYDLIVNELTNGLRLVTDPLAQSFGLVNISYFREFRTIGFQTPRQTGSSSWIIRRLIDDERALLIVKNETMLQEMKRFYQAEDEIVRKRIDNQILTIGQLRKKIANGTLLCHSYYYVDDASCYFHYFEKDLFQYFLDTNYHTPVIVLVG